MMTRNSTLGVLLEAHMQHGTDENLKDLGRQMFDLYTAHGLPPDMFINELKKTASLPQSAWVFIISEYQHHFLEHRRQSGFNEARIDKLRRHNRIVIERYIKTGELGEY